LTIVTSQEALEDAVQCAKRRMIDRLGNKVNRPIAKGCLEASGMIASEADSTIGGKRIHVSHESGSRTLSSVGY
jgi:hypothetical protein